MSRLKMRSPRRRCLDHFLVVAAAALTSIFAIVVVVALDPCDRFDMSKCDPAAECYADERRVAECRCRPGYVDLSPDTTQAAGRRCQRINFGVPALGDDDDDEAAAASDCAVDDPLSCDPHLHEVCLFRENGRYRCGCASGWSRLADGRCLA